MRARFLSSGGLRSELSVRDHVFGAQAAPLPLPRQATGISLRSAQLRKAGPPSLPPPFPPPGRRARARQ
eukprot:11828487-Alexandrium_andersonii.AAC.1